MKKFASLVAACAMLAACQTIDVSADNPPTVTVDRPVAQAQADTIAAFNDIGYHVVSRSPSRVVMEMDLVPNSAERAAHAATSKGLPKAQVVARFKKTADGVQITATNDMLVNPGRANQERISLLDTPDGPRLQRFMNGI